MVRYCWRTLQTVVNELIFVCRENAVNFLSAADKLIHELEHSRWNRNAPPLLQHVGHDTLGIECIGMLSNGIYKLLDPCSFLNSHAGSKTTFS